MVSSRRGNKRPLLHEPEGASWMARTTFSPQKFYSSGRRSVHAGRFSHAGISSTADVQGRALCPGSTPGAPLLPSGSCRSILYSGVQEQ